MCRNIRTLFNYDPPSTTADIDAAALQYVRKVSGYTKPSASNQAAFDRAVGDVARVTQDLLAALQTTASPRNRDAEIARARERNAKRFSRT